MIDVKQFDFAVRGSCDPPPFVGAGMDFRFLERCAWTMVFFGVMRIEGICLISLVFVALRRN
jgi:hypothetical protein